MSGFDEVISKIRCGELILWVGSGFSKSAGYPTGSELANIIKDKLNPDEKQYFEKKFNLDDVTEEFVQMRSRKELISVLDEVFKKEPIDLTLHEMVSKIPQIQTIITTNYDKSFERAYRNDIFTIISDQEVPASIRNKVNLYKIHGDIDISNSIIITKTDYSDYYKERKENLVWNEIRSLISKYSILFIGYSFEDSNVKSMFTEILGRLGDLHKDYYLITPNLPEHKKRYLLEKYSIHYIKMSAEDAISNIRNEVEINLIMDTEDGYVPHHLVKKIYWERKIDPDFSIAEEGKLILKDIGVLKGGPRIVWNIFLKAPIEKSSRIKKFEDILSGNIFGKCSISQDDCIINLSAKVGESLLFDPKNGDASDLTVTSIPNGHVSANLLLLKSGLFFNNLKGERYSSGSVGEIRVFHDVFDLTIKMDTGKTGQGIHFNVHAKNVMEGYHIFNFINSWIEEDLLQVNFDFLEVPYTLLFSKLFSEKVVQDMKRRYDLYSKLFRIQREFNVIFGDFTFVTDDDFNTMNEIVFLLDGSQLPQTGKIFSFQGEIVDEEHFLRVLDQGLSNFTYGPLPRNYRLLNTDIVLDCGLNLCNGFIVNKQEAISKLKQGFKKFNLEVESKTETYSVACWEILISKQDEGLILTNLKNKSAQPDD
ncbi:MAG: SIR2 family protein [Methanosarcina sp.]|uniref:SIR2 family protein n=1 Tax=Methanosarcina sp. TaxID=2213 RepID=UPI002627DB71|nr:SIR2 family protein [Methanosarcina sp.]MDD3246056.1 SIR2 family protein [Methanosarcina sp.]MDD4248970.1 SIR2 family protein [Methanosarcina sp.]